MPIPAFEPSGLLPPGVHDCPLEEIKARFGGFQGSDRRPRLFAKLEAFVAQARASRMVRELVIAGNFVTAKPAPNDIDLIVIVPGIHDLTADLPPAAYNVVSKKRVQKRFGFDIVAVREGTSEINDVIAFFHQVRGEPTARKGILRIRL